MFWYVLIHFDTFFSPISVLSNNIFLYIIWHQKTESSRKWKSRFPQNIVSRKRRVLGFNTSGNGVRHIINPSSKVSKNQIVRIPTIKGRNKGVSKCQPFSATFRKIIIKYNFLAKNKKIAEKLRHLSTPLFNSYL